ncbi:hypothetical protein [Bacillus wiedmannii]|uniref:hypothetical protein n=1 Tax=Bacillus wiedmannii TaxID=1890302 RepID=UPI0011552A84|nr:hypothetical protein [Bacillus wiedmannii]
MKTTNDFLHSLERKTWNDYMGEINDTNKTTDEFSKELGEIYVYLKNLSFINNVTERFPQLYYLNFIISWYNFFENELLELCKLYSKKIEKYPSKLRHYTQIKNFIINEIGINIDENKWFELEKGIKKLKDIIAHAGPTFDRKYKYYQNFIEKNSKKEKFYIYQELIKHINKHQLLSNNGTYTYI